MRYLKYIILFLLLSSVYSIGQTEYNWRVVSAPGGVTATGNDGFVNVGSAGASYASLSWSLSGSLASCTLQVDYSNDGSTVAGQVVAAQTCTSNGSFISVGTTTPSYIRVSYVIGSGGGILSYVARGCKNNTCIVSGNGSISNGTTGIPVITIDNSCTNWTLGSGWTCSAGTLILAAGVNQGTVSYHAASIQVPGNNLQLTLTATTNIALDIEHCGAAIMPLALASPTVTGKVYTYTCVDSSDFIIVPSGSNSSTTATINSVSVSQIIGGIISPLVETVPNTWTGVRTLNNPNFINYPYNGPQQSSMIQSNTRYISAFDGGIGVEWISTSGLVPVDDSINIYGNNKSIKVTGNTGTPTSRMDIVFGSTQNFSGAIAIRMVYYVDNPLNLGSLQIYFSNSNFTSFKSIGQYPGLGLTAVPSTPGWYQVTWPLSQFTDTGSPSMATVDKMRVGVTAQASSTVNVSFARLEMVYPTLPKSTIVLTFDDGFASQFTTARGIISTYGWPATLFVIPGAIGASGYMTLAQIQALQNIYGWDIAAHTYSHPNLANLTAAAIDNEYNLWWNWAQTNNIRATPVLAYPFGSYGGTDSATAVVEAQKYFLLARSTLELGTTYKVPETFDVRSYQYELPVHQLLGCASSCPGNVQTTLAASEAWIDTAITNPNSLTILLFHDIANTASTSTGSTQWDTADFTALMAYIATKNVNVWNFAELLNYYFPQVNNNLFSLNTTGNYTSKRISYDNATTLVAGDFTLGAGWGNTASIAITNVNSKDSAAIVTITVGGTGIAANPTLILTFKDGTWTNVPAAMLLQNGGNDIFGDVTTTAMSATAYTWQWNGTPTTAKTYQFLIHISGT